MNLRSLVPYILAPLLCSCAATSIKDTWKSPDTSGPVKKVAVITVDQRPGLRQGFENRLANQIQQTGASAMTTFDVLALPDINQDKKAAGQRLLSAGADAVAVLRLVDIATYYRETRPGGSRYGGYVSGIDSGPWYDYYSVAFTDLSPTYGNLKQKVYLETVLFDLASGKRLWSALTQTVITENMDRVAEMDPLIAKIVTAMRTDGMLP